MTCSKFITGTATITIIPPPTWFYFTVTAMMKFIG